MLMPVYDLYPPRYIYPAISQSLDKSASSDASPIRPHRSPAQSGPSAPPPHQSTPPSGPYSKQLTSQATPTVRPDLISCLSISPLLFL
ncbi:uncharacterized protein LMH87_008699 [Akanthomyces muscarius]|uniref:Uncharacterized protein n=1 Tax=Akanthomyces muscarius TaxID=2231603 RepID=A0A9W8QK79_AKAMU|nr:uncharacterized protein LMH87_008699 [Akanthomyces muscarius]KAJ4158160.1 hypothetical protein LMH87_008699 [Akanthomyces muscarius]